MKEIKCPKCGTAISVSDADSADILNLVRKEAVEDEVRRRLAVEADLRQAREAQKDAEVAARHRDVLSAKDQEITALKQRIEEWEQNKDLQMEAIKKALQVSAGHLDAAGNKVEGLTIKKLTRGNATVKAILDEARAKKVEEGPEEQ